MDYWESSEQLQRQFFCWGGGVHLDHKMKRYLCIPRKYLQYQSFSLRIKSHSSVLNWSYKRHETDTSQASGQMETALVNWCVKPKASTDSLSSCWGGSSPSRSHGGFQNSGSSIQTTAERMSGIPSQNLRQQCPHHTEASVGLLAGVWAQHRHKHVETDWTPCCALFVIKSLKYVWLRNTFF